MKDLTLARKAKRLEGNGGSQALENVDNQSLITQIIIANDDGAAQHNAKVLLNGDPLIATLIDGSSTFVQELAVPIKTTDAIVFNAAAKVYLTAVFTVPG